MGNYDRFQEPDTDYRAERVAQAQEDACVELADHWQQHDRWMAAVAHLSDDDVADLWEALAEHREGILDALRSEAQSRLSGDEADDVEFEDANCTVPEIVKHRRRVFNDKVNAALAQQAAQETERSERIIAAVFGDKK